MDLGLKLAFLFMLKRAVKLGYACFSRLVLLSNAPGSGCMGRLLEKELMCAFSAARMPHQKQKMDHSENGVWPGNPFNPPFFF